MLSVLRTGRLYPSGNSPGTQSSWRPSLSQVQRAPARITSMKNSNDPNGKRTHDLPACNTVPRSTALLHSSNISTLQCCRVLLVLSTIKFLHVKTHKYMKGCCLSSKYPTLGTRWQICLHFTHRSLYSTGKSHKYPLNRGAAWSLDLVLTFWKNKNLALPCRQPKHCASALQATA
jgi:hypothetical protein